MNEADYKVVSADEWQQERMFNWQRRQIEKLAEDRKIKWKDLMSLVMTWIAGKTWEGLNRKDAIVVAQKLREIPTNCKMEVKWVPMRSVGKVKVREF